MAHVRGMARAEKRRGSRTDQWWMAANAKALPFRRAIVKAYEKLHKLGEFAASAGMSS